ncbi:MAG: N-acetyltransferase [Chthoniobacterales bacterium]|nr:N-acetyltransferase [Chthoniobacterales bacterium]
MILRDAAEADLPAIVEIYNATIPTRMVTAELEPVSVTERLPWYREHSPNDYPIWVLEEAEQVAGWLSFSRFITRYAYRGTAEISVYVHEDFRRHGVAAELLDAAMARGPELGFTAFVGLIFGHNEPSLRLFTRCGFEKWGHLPRIARLDGVERDLVIVGRHLPSLA